MVTPVRPNPLKKHPTSSDTPPRDSSNTGLTGKRGSKHLSRLVTDRCASPPSPDASGGSCSSSTSSTPYSLRYRSPSAPSSNPSSANSSPSTQEMNPAKPIYQDIFKISEDSRSERKLAVIYGDWVRKILFAWSDESMMPDEIKFALRGTFIHALELFTENVLLDLYQTHTGIELDFHRSASLIPEALKHHRIDSILGAFPVKSGEITKLLNKTGLQYTVVARYEDERSKSNTTTHFYNCSNSSDLHAEALNLFTLHFKIYLYVLNRLRMIHEIPDDRFIPRLSSLGTAEKVSIRENRVFFTPSRCQHVASIRKKLQEIAKRYPSQLIEELDYAIRWMTEGTLHREYYPILLHTLYRTAEYSILHILRTQKRLATKGHERVIDYADYLTKFPSGAEVAERLDRLLLGKILDYFNRGDNAIIGAINESQLASTHPSHLANVLFDTINYLTSLLIDVAEIFKEAEAHKTIRRALPPASSAAGPSSSTAAISPTFRLPHSSSGFYTVPLSINGTESQDYICKIMVNSRSSQILITPYLRTRSGKYEANAPPIMLDLSGPVIPLIKALDKVPAALQEDPSPGASSSKPSSRETR